ncbi:MAG: beta-lactamase family protein, partial [Planctomycetes bacterium]|nr:beta-lactamase family protein [Planctomycetota bacterium]
MNKPTLFAMLASGLIAVANARGQNAIGPPAGTSTQPASVVGEERSDSAPCVVSTGETDPRMESFDRMMCEFVNEHHVPGAALAVTDQGRLVYARGFGYADVESRQAVTATSLFRIASLSKPITAVAVLQLIEQGRLHMDDKVFEILTFEPHLPDGSSCDDRLRAITIRHLLEHRGGWDRDRSFDPMFQSVRFAEMLGVRPPAEPEHIIRCMLGQPLDFDPGERYAYSNFGYCLLGRVIEAVTGQSYERYVQERVLAPLGIRSMRIGKTRLNERAENEVHYYDSGRGRSVFDESQNEF